ncbi:MAG TPA: S53 family peptidase [Gaiellaceae bacterium]|nr:S53 family peptidase [Gaiellaceae bacterium]
MKVITRTRLIAAVALGAAVVVAASLGGTSRASSPQFNLPALKGPAVAQATADGCNSIFESLFGIPCYGPYELGKAYDYPSNLDGSGQTIVIVDAYGSKNIQADLQLFDAQFGIPDPAPGKFVVVNGPAATAAGSGDVDDWGLETSLDVEYAHAMAPGARIVLVQGSSDDDNDLNNAERQWLPHYPGAIVSHSFGDWETDTGAAEAASDAHKIYSVASLLGETMVASSGDAGATWTQYTGTTTPALASYPASDPLVTAVGGTQGLPYPDGLYQNGGYGGEQAWNEAQFDSAGGGAPSMLFSAPSWQRGITGYKVRTEPDVSYNAAIEGGVGVVYTLPEDTPGPDTTSIYLVGGTSAGSPQWASIFALVNQARAQAHRLPLGPANAALYRIAKNRHSADDFHDITVGNNALDSSVGFNAGPGYDIATGLGTPDVAKLVPDLAAQPTGIVEGIGSILNAPRHQGQGHKHHLPHTAVPG